MDEQAMIAALAGQVEGYQRLAKLAALQHEHVQQNQIEGLLEVLQRRQRVLDELARLEQTLVPAKRQWSAWLETMSQAARRQAEALLAETRRLLEEITLADRNDALVLQQRKLNVGRQINQARAARQVNRNYATAAYGAPAARLNIGG